MSSSGRKRILLATDGSEHSLKTVRYAASMLDPERFEVVLFHVFTRVPESFIDLEKMPAYRYRIVDVEAWEHKQEQLIDQYMVKAKAILSEAGFDPGSVTAKVAERKVGIARDIAEESENGYGALLVGRKGLSELKDFMLGSIAHKIIQLVRIPIWIVGSGQEPRKILVCIDSSEGSMLAAGHVSEILDGSDKCDILLFHAARGLSGLKKLMLDVFGSEEHENEIEKMEKQFSVAGKLLEPSFDKVRANLTAAGVEHGRIAQKITTGVANSGNAIIEEAEKGGYDTIVVGRRGLGKVEEFIMGRVSSKVLHMAKDKTVWIVN